MDITNIASIHRMIKNGQKKVFPLQSGLNYAGFCLMPLL
jgi:hypothetical protein